MSSEESEDGLRNTRRLVRQTGLLISSGVVSYGGQLLLYVVLARVLGSSGFGAWALAFALARTIGPLGILGADWIVLRQASFYQGKGDEPRFRSTLYLGFALSTVALMLVGGGLVATSNLIAREVFEDPSIAPLLRLTGITAPLMGIQQIMLAGTQAFKSMREVALLRNLLRPLARVIFVSGAVILISTEFSAYVGLTIAEAVIAVASVYALNRRIPILGPTKPVDHRGLIKFALPAWGTRALTTSHRDIYSILVGSLAALASTGVFVASQQVAGVSTTIIFAMNQVYGPMGSDLYLQGRATELKSLFQSIAKWSFVLGFPLFCFQIGFPKEILSFFGKNFVDQSFILVFLSLGNLLSFGTGPSATTLLIAGRARMTFINNVSTIGGEVVLAIWLIPAYGLLGAGIARVIGVALNNLIRMIQVRVLLGYWPYRTDYWKPLVAGFVSLGLAKLVIPVTGLGLRPAAAVAAALVIGVSYVGLVLILRLTDEDKMAIHALTGRLRRKGQAKSDDSY
jgi:O-antigen/teichoic acid export membrane protein